MAKKQPTASFWTPAWRRFVWAFIWLGLLSASCFWIWQYYLANPAYYPLQTVRITGQFTHLNQAQIERQLSHKVLGSGFFSIDLVMLHQAILALPWVAEASIRRVWPDALDIRVTEQIPLARWQHKQPAYWINAAGEHFQPRQAVALSVPVFLGEAGQIPEMMAFYHQVQPALSSLGLKIQQLQLNKLGEWQLNFTNGLNLYLGYRQPLQRWRDFQHIYPQLTEQPLRMDMRYEQGFALQNAKDSD
jgi:cell division protein FtsQ